MPALTRRRLLLAAGAAAALGAAGCSSTSEGTDATGAADADVLLADVATDEQGLIARYDAAIAAFPGMAAPLRAIRDQHADHLAALGTRPRAVPSAGAPATPDGAIAGLRDAERQAARARRAACVAADDTQVARLLALIAASEASHVPALKSVRPA